MQDMKENNRHSAGIISCLLFTNNKYLTHPEGEASVDCWSKGEPVDDTFSGTDELPFNTATIVSKIIMKC